MKKRDYFIAALKAGNYSKLDWCISAFALINGEGKTLYPFALKSDPTGYLFYTAEGQWEKIEDATPGEPLFKPKDRIIVGPNDIVNVDKEVDTLYGNVMLNYILLVHPFGKKIPFQTGKLSTSGMAKKLILPLLEDNPENVEDEKEDRIYVREFLKYTRSVYYLSGFSQICVWAATEKNMVAPDGLAAFKEQLLKKYEGKLDDAATIALMDKEIIEFDAKWRGDDPGNNFLIGKKSLNSRKKKVLMYGGEKGADGNANRMVLIKNSLDEGWDINAFSAMNDTLRMGSFARGAETMLGGVEVKWMLRASSNMNVTSDDCGSKVGIPRYVTEKNVKKLVGFNLVGKDKPIPLTNEEEAGKYLGKLVMVRSPMYCNLDRTDYCKACIGKRLSDTPFALSSAVSAYGSAFLSLFMSAAHSKALEVKKLDWKAAFV